METTGCLTKTQNGVSIDVFEMPDLMDRMYCSEQIHIPPTFPYIMKLYCKAAIRTQPYDLLKWSAAYFRALANGEEPPVKERVEYPPYDSPSGLTPGYIKILINQFGKDPDTTITAQTLFKKWSDICLDEYLLVKLIALLGANTTVNWMRFVGVCAGFISKTLTQTMILICELFTEEPEGGMATVPYDIFIDLYIFLANMNCGPLTDKEKADLAAIMDEEEICEVADRIKKGMYEGGLEGEITYLGEMGDEEVSEVVHDEESLKDDFTTKKGFEEISTTTTEEETKKEEDIPETKEEFFEPSKEEVGETREPSLESEGGPSEEDGDDNDLEDIRATSESFFKEPGSSDSIFSERPKSFGTISEDHDASDKDKEASEKDKEASFMTKEEAEILEESKEKVEEEEKPKPKLITLEDLEESVRAKIEEKLAEEEEEEAEEKEGEDDTEFENLGSYLLDASKRVEKFTAETLGFKIFRKYMRQEVPGIGPVVPSDQVEKVVDFMDLWSHKQELMVMPRNIRHWMCPPLDKLPTPEP